MNNEMLKIAWQWVAKQGLSFAIMAVLCYIFWQKIEKMELDDKADKAYYMKQSINCMNEKNALELENFRLKNENQFLSQK